MKMGELENTGERDDHWCESSGFGADGADLVRGVEVSLDAEGSSWYAAGERNVIVDVVFKEVEGVVGYEVQGAIYV